MMSAIKTGAVSHSRFAQVAENVHRDDAEQYGKDVARSGGGL